MAFQPIPQPYRFSTSGRFRRRNSLEPLLPGRPKLLGMSGPATDGLRTSTRNRVSLSAAARQVKKGSVIHRTPTRRSDGTGTIRRSSRESFRRGTARQKWRTPCESALLNDLLLAACELPVAGSIGGHLEAIFSERYQTLWLVAFRRRICMMVRHDFRAPR